MIDVKHLIENPDQYRASQTARGADVAAVDRMIEADTSRRASIASFEELRAEQKAFGKRVAQAQGEEKQALLAEVKELAAQVKAAEAAAGEAEAALARASIKAEVGAIETHHNPVRIWGPIRRLDGWEEVREWELGTASMTIWAYDDSFLRDVAFW